METIFDHKPNRDELNTILGYIPDKESYDLKFADQDHEYSIIYGLYVYRKDTETANKFLHKIKNKQLKFDVQFDDITV